MDEKSKKLGEIYGEVQELITPSGHHVTIRQQNGEDDDILTKGSSVMDGSATSNFIRAIVVQSDYSKSPTITPEDIINMKLCDKYFIMVASRIFSLGANLIFDYDWGQGKISKYVEDLNQYLWDYNDSENFPEIGAPEYFKYRIRPHKHPKDKFREIKLTSGKEVSYHFSNSKSEAYVMNLVTENQFKNQELLARGLTLKEDGTYINVKGFKKFTAFDMMEIRKDIEDNDPNLEIMSDVENPNTGEMVPLPILGTPDFFFPREI